MTLDEFYTKATNKPSENFAINEAKISGRAAEYRQFNTIGEDSTHTVKDSIHLDWTPVSGYCLECGVTVKIWDGFAHRLLWNQTWKRAVAFQPLSTRYEGDRSDSPIEGFVFRFVFITIFIYSLNFKCIFCAYFKGFGNGMTTLEILLQLADLPNQFKQPQMTSRLKMT